MMGRAMLRRLLLDARASMAIETAIVAPTLIMMTLGAFEVSTMVARQQELQTAANEAAIIAVATNRGASVTPDQLAAIIRSSVDVNANQLTISQRFRCGTSAQLVTARSSCTTGQAVSTYMTISITDQHEPIWHAYGLGRAINFSVQRTVQVS
jgi:Flp pilus assembly protein TadG